MFDFLYFKKRERERERGEGRMIKRENKS